MKYLITESQFDKVIFQYLDNQDFIQIVKGNRIYFVNSESDEYAQIVYYKTHGWCVIYFDLIKEISSFFSLKNSDSSKIISKWVENITQMKVKDIQSAGKEIFGGVRIPSKWRLKRSLHWADHSKKILEYLTNIFIFMDKDLERVLFSYLDSQDFIQIEKNNRIYFVNSEGDEFAQIRYDKEKGYCMLKQELVKEISSFFSLELSVSKEVIGRWVENTLQMKVTDTVSPFAGHQKQLRIPSK